MNCDTKKETPMSEQVHLLVKDDRSKLMGERMIEIDDNFIIETKKMREMISSKRKHFSLHKPFRR
jgi:hypothetical protein